MAIDPATSWPPRLQRELQSWPAVQPIAADGSDRLFFRLRRGAESCICLYHPQPPGHPVTENDSYDAIGRHLRGQGVPVPEIFTYCREEGWFLLEDVGARSLQDEYLSLPGPEARLELYRQTLKVLVQMQVRGTPGFDPRWCFDTPFYDAELVTHREWHYFRQAFLWGYLGLDIAPEAGREDLALLLERTLCPPEHFLVHRDFQSRNLMVQPDRLRLLDFQGARLGPPHYDLAALLIDPYVNLSPADQETLLADYLRLLQENHPLDPAAWRRRYHHVALCRNLQILGAYGFLSRQKGKKFFEPFIPLACRSLQHRLACLPPAEFAWLRHLAAQAANLVGKGQSSA